MAGLTCPARLHPTEYGRKSPRAVGGRRAERGVESGRVTRRQHLWTLAGISPRVLPGIFLLRIACKGPPPRGRGYPLGGI